MPVVWIGESVVFALHEEHLAEHGRAIDIRDRELLESALYRLRNLTLYEEADIAGPAAAYGFGIARNHPFMDGNKRTAFTVTELFLALNRQELIVDDQSCVITILKLAEGSLSEKEFANWIRDNAQSD